MLSSSAIVNAFENGAPETIRTSDLPLRRGLLYPAELLGRDSTPIKSIRYCIGVFILTVC